MNNDNIIRLKSRALTQGLTVSVIAGVVMLFATGCVPRDSIPPQAACAPSLGGNLALHDVNSTSSSAQWPKWGGDLHNTHHAATETRITTANVKDLGVKWRFIATGSVTNDPTIEGDTLYFADFGPGIGGKSTLFSLNRWTGERLWSKPMMDYTNNDFNNIIRTSPAIAGDLMIIGDYQDPALIGTFPWFSRHYDRYINDLGDPCGGYVMAVKRDNPNAGQLVWSTRIGSLDWDQITQSPVVYNDTVFVGLSSQESTYVRAAEVPCCNFRGKLAALDLHTGALKWERYMTTDNFGALDQFSGSSVWGGTPTIDEDRNLVYVGTGQNYSVPQELEECIVAADGDLLQYSVCAAPYTENYFDSIIALDIDTGLIEWVVKSRDYDVWSVACDFEYIMPILAITSSRKNCAEVKGIDADFAQPPMLYTVMENGQPVIENGKPKQLMAAGTKGGVAFIIDPDAATEAQRVVWSGPVGPDGLLGGMEFGAATDGERLYFQNTNFLHKTYTLEAGSPGHENETINGGFWSALDSQTGEIIWQTPVPAASLPLEGDIFHVIWGERGKGYFAWPMGAPTVANGVVFAGVSDWDGTMVAMDAATGEILWQYQTGQSIAGAASVVDGRLYWGAGHKLGKDGNSLYSFALPSDNR